MPHEIVYGTSVIRYTISRADRKTLAIEVHPDLSVNVVAPLKATLVAIEEKIIHRASWIRKQQYYFEQFLPHTPKREYVSGESHYYLGRKYLLRVRKSAVDTVKIKGGELVVTMPNPSDTMQVKKLITQWYHHQAVKKFESALSNALTTHFRNKVAERPQLIIRKMSRRWGSYTSHGKITLNPEIIRAPSRCIDYVVIHELCHSVHYNHSTSFYHLQDTLMPDWPKWKQRLERVMA